MANWQVEIARMAMYIFFPIGTFYYSSQSETIARWIENERKRLDNAGTKEHTELLQLIDEFSNKRQMKDLMEMEAKYNKTNM